MFIRQYLHLDMPRIENRLLQINFAVSKGPQRLTLRRLQCGLQLRGRGHQAHALASAASGGFQHHGIAYASA